MPTWVNRPVSRLIRPRSIFRHPFIELHTRPQPAAGHYYSTGRFRYVRQSQPHAPERAMPRFALVNQAKGRFPNR